MVLTGCNSNTNTGYVYIEGSYCGQQITSDSGAFALYETSDVKQYLEVLEALENDEACEILDIAIKPPTYASSEYYAITYKISK